MKSYQECGPLRAELQVKVHFIFNCSCFTPGKKEKNRYPKGHRQFLNSIIGKGSKEKKISSVMERKISLFFKLNIGNNYLVLFYLHAPFSKSYIYTS